MSSISTLSELITEYYDIACLPESDQAKYRLISKYRDKVSKRLLDEKKELREKARGLFADFLCETLMKPNPFLAMLKNESQLSHYYPVPILNQSNGNNDMSA